MDKTDAARSEVMALLARANLARAIRSAHEAGMLWSEIAHAVVHAQLEEERSHDPKDPRLADRES